MLELVNYDQLFSETPNAHVLPITDLATPGKVKDYVTQICSSTSHLAFSASCENGCTTGNFYIGTECPTCHTIVRENFAKELRYHTWIAIPDFAPPILHPQAYVVMCHVLPPVKQPDSTQSVPLLNLIMDNEADLPEELADKVPQGMLSFYEKFWDIMNTVIEEYEPLQKGKRTQQIEDLKRFLHKFEDRLFVHRLPILDPSLHLLTKHGGVTRTDAASPIVVNAITTLSGVVHAFNIHSDKFNIVDQQLYRFYEIWVQYPASILVDKVTQKKGMCRKCVLGARTHCSFRGVIVPIIVPHDSDELHVPWKVGVNLLKLEILNVLINRQKMTFDRALGKFFTAETTYDPDVDKIMQTLIKECPFKGLPTLFGRNPSIRLGCEQLLFITRISTDLTNSAIGISPRIVKAPNADFDGDNMNGLVIKEMDVVVELTALHPMNTMLGGPLPGITGNVMITEQELVTLQAYVAEGIKCKS